MYKLSIPLFVPILPDPVMSERLAIWQAELEKMVAEHIVKWAIDTFVSQVAFASSWTEEDFVINSILGREPEPIPTVDLVHRLLFREMWSPLDPRETVHSTFDGRSASTAIWARFHVEHLCKRHEKIIGRYQAWIVSARREQDTMLEHMPVLSWCERFGVLRIAPLAAWSKEDVEQRIQENKAVSGDPFFHRKKNRTRPIPSGISYEDSDSVMNELFGISR